MCSTNLVQASLFWGLIPCRAPGTCEKTEGGHDVNVQKINVCMCVRVGWGCVCLGAGLYALNMGSDACLIASCVYLF